MNSLNHLLSKYCILQEKIVAIDGVRTRAGLRPVHLKCTSLDHSDTMASTTPEGAIFKIKIIKLQVLLLVVYITYITLI